MFKAANDIGLIGKESTFAFLLKNMYQCFIERDCEVIRVNPLILTKDGKFRAANPRVFIDNKAYFRQAEMTALFDHKQLSPKERIAKMAGLRYNELNWHTGKIGMICNGTGLSMATDDLVSLHGGKVTNYLDLDGDSTIEDAIEAFDLMEHDNRVKVTLVNIFAGVKNLEAFTKGLVIAREKGGLVKPVIVRLKGQFSDEAKERL